MPFFNVGDKVYNRGNPDKIYLVKKVNDIVHCIPNYILIDTEGNVSDNFCVGWVKWVTPDDTLRYGEVLTDDINYICRPEGDLDIRIRTIQYESRIFYHKMVNGEVVEFKELS